MAKDYSVYTVETLFDFKKQMDPAASAENYQDFESH
ncbi:MAG: hypothetical protein ACI8WB_004933 [Phenylobacterium sp.]|jgi:hypothetical protein